jgi:hypothetical protein
MYRQLVSPGSVDKFALCAAWLQLTCNVAPVTICVDTSCNASIAHSPYHSEG